MTKYRTQTKYRSYTSFTIKECIDWTSLAPRLSQKPGYEAMTTCSAIFCRRGFTPYVPCNLCMNPYSVSSIPFFYG